jgi:RNase H-like domain found in reverse transcriptase
MALAFPDPDKRICVLTDASDRFYAGLVTQMDDEQLDLPMEEQIHQPLAFLSGEFKGAQLRCTREGRFRHSRHSDQGELPVAKS